MSKRFLSSAFLATILIGGLVLTSAMRFGTTQASTDVNGIINSDTTWTKANSPYTITQPVTVNSGVTLTIEPGVTAIMNQNVYLQVDGAVVAIGTSAEKILFNGGEIRLMPNSTGWNEQTASDSVIENAIFNGAIITVSNSAKINNNTIIGAIDINGGSPYILNNTIYGSRYFYAINICGGSPQIEYNRLVGGIVGNESARFPIISNNSVEGQVTVGGGSPVISGNLITGPRRQMYIVNNDTFQLNTNNNYSSPSIGIGLTGYNFGENKLYGAVVTDNVIVDCLTGICWNAGEGAIIERNLIINSSREGLSIGSNALIRNNSIINSLIGINLYNFNVINDGPSDPQFPPMILNNNIENNSQYNIYSYCGSDLNATYNWWGTIDEQSIQNTIYDKAFDSALGIISFMPCLMAPNSKVYPNSIYYNHSSVILTHLLDNIFSIESNSTISALFFNETASEIRFTANGPSETTGYVKATILEQLMPNPEDIQVYLDGNQIDCTITSNGNSWIITFTYNHSEHEIAIVSSAQPTIPEISSPIILPLFMIAIIIAAVADVVYFKKRKH